MIFLISLVIGLLFASPFPSDSLVHRHTKQVAQGSAQSFQPQGPLASQQSFQFQFYNSQNEDGTTKEYYYEGTQIPWEALPIPSWLKTSYGPSLLIGLTVGALILFGFLVIGLSVFLLPFLLIGFGLLLMAFTPMFWPALFIVLGFYILSRRYRRKST